MAMDKLAERIKAAIENANGELWFPELTADLAAQAWGSLHRDLGLTLDTYGTERVLSRNPFAPREVITKLSTCSSTRLTSIAIEAISRTFNTQYDKHGIVFYTPDEILRSSVLSCIEEALEVINQVPSLMRTIATLVRSLHVIKPADEDHDVSFSEPHIPFSIFVSIPEKRFANDALRVAEAIVHEAMHLNLTLVEQIVSLIGATSERYYSPWRRESRDSEGILQAVFVFETIDRFLNELLSANSELASNSLINQRRGQIREQICQVRSFRDSNELTEVGSKLAARLLCRWAQA
jgi:hypothetical protein